jgi:hypothetical protein
MHDFIPCGANLHRMQISTGNTSTLLQTVRAGVLQKKQPSMRWWSATLLAFSGRIREKTGIKHPRLCPRTWSDDLHEDTWCRKEDRVVILCGMWSFWNSRRMC